MSALRATRVYHWRLLENHGHDGQDARFYHEQGLLTPSFVDDETGYRYYDRSKVETARIIGHLRSLDLSLDEIGVILRTAGDDADLRDVMERQKVLLEAKIRRYREIVLSLNRFLARRRGNETLMMQSHVSNRRKDR